MSHEVEVFEVGCNAAICMDNGGRFTGEVLARKRCLTLNMFIYLVSYKNAYGEEFVVRGMAELSGRNEIYCIAPIRIDRERDKQDALRYFNVSVVTDI